MSYTKQPRTLRALPSAANKPAINLASATLVALSSITSSHLHAAENSVTELDGMTVTSQRQQAGSNPNADADAPYKIDYSGNEKFAEPLLNVSKTINVVGKEQLQDSGVTALKELMRTQPGITLGTGEGGNAYGDRFIIRGFEARGDILVDGLRDPGVVNREIFATEQVEISKGPSSTFAGRGTTGGAVNSITKKPQTEDFTTATITLGNEQRATLDANRVVNDKLSVRSNIMWQDTDVAGRNEVFDKRKGFSIAADYQATDKTHLLLDYYHLDTDSMPDWGHPWDTTTQAPLAVDRDNFYGLTKRDYQATEADIVTATLGIELSPQTIISSKTRIGETSNAYIATAPYFSRTDPTKIDGTEGHVKTAGFTNEYKGHATQISHEFYHGKVEHTLAAGFEISQETISNQKPTVTGSTALLDPENPDNANPNIGEIGRSTSKSVTEANTYSLYVLDHVSLNEQFKVFGGLRYDSYEIERDTDANEYDPASESSLKTDFVNGHAGVIYKPQENGSIYASYSTSSNLPGELMDATAAAYGGLTPETAELTKPERNRSIELGTKWNLRNDDLSINAAIFRTDKDNAIETTGGRGTPLVSSQTGEVRVQGIEASISGKLNPKLSLTGGVAFMDSEVLASVEAGNVGKELANTAHQSAFVQAKYAVNPKLSVGGTLTHKGKIQGGTLAADSGLELPATERLDLMAEYKINRNLNVQANIKNATDETIYEAFYRNATPFTYVAPGRSATVSLSYDF